MATAYAPSSQSEETKNVAPSFSRVYMVVSVSGRSSFTLGPAENELELAQNADDRWEPSEVLTGQRFLMNAANQLIAY